jgi:hypothetical protein
MTIRNAVYSVLTLIVALSPLAVVGMLIWYIYLEEKGNCWYGHPFIFMLVILALIAADLVLENMKPPLEPPELPRFQDSGKE